jgi:pimeloyl-[acyl-carrier protein] methyl ester esterase
MSLISPSPCFLTRRDWDRGFEKQTFEKLLRVTNKKYELGTQLFLKLQSPSMPSQVFESVLNQLKLSQPTADGLQTGFESLCESDLRSRLTEITIPTQIISARTDDIIPPPASHYVSERLPNAICETIGNDHAIPISHHHELARSISNFFGELPK